LPYIIKNSIFKTMRKENLPEPTPLTPKQEEILRRGNLSEIKEEIERLEEEIKYIELKGLEVYALRSQLAKWKEALKDK